MGELGRGEKDIPSFVQVERRGKDKPHEFFILLLVEMLRKNGYKNINFDHATGVCPKDKSVPLTKEDGRADIAVGLDEEMFAQIEVDIRCVQE